MARYKSYNHNGGRGYRRYPSHRNYHRRRNTAGTLSEGLGRVAMTGARTAFRAVQKTHRAYRTVRRAAKIGYRLAKAPFQIGKEIYKGFKK